jgi:hypothetical protein
LESCRNDTCTLFLPLMTKRFRAGSTISIIGVVRAFALVFGVHIISDNEARSGRAPASAQSREMCLGGVGRKAYILIRLLIGLAWPVGWWMHVRTYVVHALHPAAAEMLGDPATALLPQGGGRDF